MQNAKLRNTILHDLFLRKRRTTTQAKDGKRTKRMHKKPKNRKHLATTHKESRHKNVPVDAQKSIKETYL